MRIGSFFKTNTTLSLLQRVSKQCDEADKILKIVDEYDRLFGDWAPNTGVQQSRVPAATPDSSSTRSLRLLSRKIFSMDERSVPHEARAFASTLHFAPTFFKGSNCYKFLWIRMALIHKCLLKIIECVIADAAQHYAPHAVCSDQVDSAIFCSLLVGPCALEYTRIKMNDQLWMDPNADELIMRHRMHSSLNQFSLNLNSSNTNLHIANPNSHQATQHATIARTVSSSSSTSVSVNAHKRCGEPQLVFVDVVSLVDFFCYLPKPRFNIVYKNI